MYPQYRKAGTSIRPLGHLEECWERITIGRFPTLSVEQARVKAKRYLADLGEGISVSARLRNETLAGKTLGDVHREYLSSRGVSIITVKRKDGNLVGRPELGINAKLKALTARDYVKLMSKPFADWRHVAGDARDRLSALGFLRIAVDPPTPRTNLVPSCASAVAHRIVIGCS
jgi:hypothetical protein